MKAYLIDPTARTVREIALDPAHMLKGFYAAIDCELVECIAHHPLAGHDIWIDEEGLLYDDPPHGLFIIPASAQQIYAGRAVVTGGPDKDGNTTAATCSAEDIAREVFAVLDFSRDRVVAAPLTVLPKAYSNGTSGQDRDSYSDTQDRDSYTA